MVSNGVTFILDEVIIDEARTLLLFRIKLPANAEFEVGKPDDVALEDQVGYSHQVDGFSARLPERRMRFPGFWKFLTAVQYQTLSNFQWRETEFVLTDLTTGQTYHSRYSFLGGGGEGFAGEAVFEDPVPLPKELLNLWSAAGKTL